MTVRSYSTKANALRALKSICEKCVKFAKQIIREEEGRFVFDEDKIEEFMTTKEWQEVYGASGSGLPVEEEESKEEVKYETEAMKVQQAVAEAVRTEIKREAQKTSMKLDRTIMVYENGKAVGTWKNACAMWKQHPDWMTSAQEDGLTKKLYDAAKRGEKIVVEINGRAFELVNV